MERLGADTATKLGKAAKEKTDKVSEGDGWREMYRWAFAFSLSSGAKSVELDLAVAMLRLLFSRHNLKPHAERMFEFLESEPSPTRAINRDQWAQLPEFLEEWSQGTAGQTESWPLLFDRFMEWTKGST
ncbi:hypothetical protein M427DRAFT_58074 [Gonapodya prolifera JEL478]|uniref:Defective in cullin neddylation protein n=1 Tax=Gonapodya prolifera (strain JEL478) TaxID=1344416 RepID=A0A139ABH7_GONPJ|nr:hypothetical protein M427DRAFT_58074 [Gonapodya prolifera JEL478]|eukprot:KXS13825.1 hypothetical protein M427DRAFT_58074 [Gonapodya prolifera JEL478]